MEVVEYLDVNLEEVETGENAKPVFILTSWYRSFIMNGGAVADSLKDSTIVAIDYRYELVPLANFMGSIEVGANPNSAVWINDLKILCKGIYNPNNSLNNTEATLVRVHPWNMYVVWTQNLSNIYNARNLVATSNDNVYFFTAMDGIYNMYNNGTSILQISPIVSDFLFIKKEEYNPTDTTTAQANMLYINDAVNNASTIYKYNTATSTFCDTIVVDGNVRDIAFY